MVLFNVEKIKTMDKLTLLGTGQATVTKCYNTCFTLSAGEEHFLVDTGGGNGILVQLERASIPLQAIHHVFVSHAHIDHLLGIAWLIRMIGSDMDKGDYQGNLHIYVHEEVAEIITKLAKLTLSSKVNDLFGERIIIYTVKDGEERLVAGYPVQFFDIHSQKMKQFGFVMRLHNGKRLAFIGDEPYNETERRHVYKVDWLLHEAFCLHRDKDKYKPHEFSHATVKEACNAAKELKVKNLVLYHTEDDRLEQRKVLYTAEGKRYFDGNIFVPDDLEVIQL